MSCLEKLLRERIAAGEEDLRKAVRAPMTGGILRSYLPQTWVLTTDRESLIIYVDLEGHFTVREGDSMVRDGSIAGRHDVLAESMRTGKMPPPSALQISYYTKKGEMAFHELAPMFGW